METIAQTYEAFPFIVIIHEVKETIKPNVGLCY